VEEKYMATAFSSSGAHGGVDTGSMSHEMSALSWRICAWAGPVFLVALLGCWAGIAGFFPPPSQAMTAAETKQWFLDNGTRIRLGLLGYMLFAALYMPWSVAISEVLQRIEGRRGVFSRTEMAGGIATALVALLAGVMWMAAAYRTDARTAEDIQLLMDLGWFIFDITFAVTSVQMVAVGLAILMDRRVTPLYPTWLAWMSFAFAATMVPLLLIPFVNDGPFAWNGLFNFYVALGGAFTWDVCIAFLTFGAIRQVLREEAS
jgi:hypothetical protein